MLCYLYAGNTGANGAGVVLESCASSVAAGDGRDLFSLSANGQLMNVVSGKCVGAQDGNPAEGVKLVVGDCGSAPQWEALGNGQLKAKGTNDLCLSQSGLAPGTADVASKAAVSASSTSNSVAHGESSLKSEIACALSALLTHMHTCRCCDGCRRRRCHVLGIQI